MTKSFDFPSKWKESCLTDGTSMWQGSGWDADREGGQTKRKVKTYTSNQQVYPQRSRGLNDADQQENLQWIEIRVKLEQFHYLNGQLNLRCTAQIPGIYSETSEVQLGAGLREPVPERVTSENGSETPAAVYLTMLMLCMLQLFLR
ncbi:hypothetical protein ANTPLA_LOCUS7781 [Anthophora plagiata]